MLKKAYNSAVKIFNGIIDESEILILNPQIAPVEKSLLNKSKIYHSLVVSKGKYKVIYFVENKIIYIARVWNCLQNPKNYALKID